MVLLKSAQREEDTLRLLLVPSEKNNVMSVTTKPRTREVSSRYNAGISSTPISNCRTPRRCSSPTASRTSPTPATLPAKQAQSTERRRPITQSLRFSTPTTPSSRPSTPSSPSLRSTIPIQDSETEMHSSTRRLHRSKTPDGLWPSMHSLSSSSQSESALVPAGTREKVVISSSSDQRVKPQANAAPERKRTPLKGRNASDQPENSQPTENSSARVIDQHRWPGMLGRRVSANVLSRNVDLIDEVSKSAHSSVPSRGVSPKRTSASDGAARDYQQLSGDTATQPSTSGSGRIKEDAKLDVNSSSQLSQRSSSATSISRTQSLPIPGPHCPSSPSRLLSMSLSTSKGMQSPLRTRPSTPISSTGNAAAQLCAKSSVLNYIVESQKGKKNASHIEAAHQLRLLYNVLLQCHFANAQADDTFYIQNIRFENILFTVWNIISKLRDSIVTKRIEVQHLRQRTKLAMILKEQIAYLDCWAELEREHDSSLSESIDALKASTLQLPVSGGARADVLSVKNAVSSAVDGIQAMGSSACYLLPKVKSTESMISELSVVAAKERAMLSECRELLASAATIQVQESSLRTHIVQLRHDAHKMKKSTT